MILLSTLSELAFGLESDLQDSVDWGRNLLADFNAGKTQLVLFQWSSNSGAIDVKMDGSVFEEKVSFKILGPSFSCKLDWGSYIVFLVKTASKRIVVLIFRRSFFRKTFLFSWNTAWSTSIPWIMSGLVLLAASGLDMMGKIQKWAFRSCWSFT